MRDLVVIKSSGRRENFDRDKLGRSLRMALRKRVEDEERIGQIISGIVRRLESMGETDIRSKAIGEIAMEALAGIDTAAYFRFACEYRDFQALASLSDREERILRLRYGIGNNADHTLAEIGRQFGVTRERIRQIEARALRKLRSYLDQ